MAKKENNNTIFIILIIIAVIIIYIASLGQVNIVQNNVIQEKEKNLSKLKRRHQKLKTLIEKKESLNKKLNKKFKWIYFGVRFGLTAMYITFNLFLFLYLKITEIGEILDWNEVAIITISIFSFLTFGTFTKLSQFIQDIKMKLEIRIYSNYENLVDEIKKNKNEIKSLSIKIEETQLIQDKKTIEIKAN
jgi:hypothetical protein